MPSIVRTTIGDIAMWVRQGPQAAWDIGTSQAVITGDEYGLQPFLNSPLRHEVRTVVDIGANIGAFTLAARRMFPNARVIAIEPDPDNTELNQAWRRYAPGSRTTMKVLSRWIDEMPMIAVDSLILSTPALTCESHSGLSGWSL